MGGIANLSREQLARRFALKVCAPTELPCEWCVLAFRDPEYGGLSCPAVLESISARPVCEVLACILPDPDEEASYTVVRRETRIPLSQIE